jgi:Na+-transporting methylmalonyl-CoA/oxaloacetate decarboxylase gamma subunit
MDKELFSIGLQVTLYGLCGVFSVLILFYFITKIMVSVFSKRASNGDGSN